MNVMTRTPRILEDAPKPERRKLLGLPFAKNDNKPTPTDHAVIVALSCAGSVPPELPPIVSPEKETEHQKVFRLVGERKFREAARLAKRLIDAGYAEGFFIYGRSLDAKRAKDWFDGEVVDSRRSITTAVQNIRPEHAQVLLQHNPSNRHIKSDNLEYLMRDLVSGAWEINGETIIVVRGGKVGDGQHRCWASVLTGIPFKTAITFGVLESAVPTIDIGAKRTAADRLKMRGQSDAVVVAATAAVLFEIDNGRKGTEAEIDRYVFDNSAAIQAGVAARGTSNIKGIGPSGSAATATILLRKGADAEKIKEFFKIVRTAEMTKAGNPARTIHIALFPPDRTVKPLSLNRVSMVSLLANHYSAWLRGKTVREPLLGRAIPEAI